jgi:hypothetical protein
VDTADPTTRVSAVSGKSPRRGKLGGRVEPTNSYKLWRSFRSKRASTATSASSSCDVASSLTTHMLTSILLAPFARNARCSPTVPSACFKSPIPVSQAASTTIFRRVRIEKFSSSTMLMIALLSIPGLITGCSDLALGPDLYPATIRLVPFDTVLTEGEQGTIRLTLIDQRGDRYPDIPFWGRARWSVLEPQIVAVESGGSFQALASGKTTVEAEVAGLTAAATVRVNPRELALGADVAYLTQSTQRPEGTVPLVAGREALLRVFLTADRDNFFSSPGVRAVFYLDNEEIYSVLMNRQLQSILRSVDERGLFQSYNAVIPASAVKPRLEMVLDIDPDHSIPARVDGRRVPAVGRSAIDVRAVPPLGLRIIPVRQVLTGRTASVFGLGEVVKYMRTIFPIEALDVDTRDMYSTMADLKTEAGWRQLLLEIKLLRLTDESVRYYYGAVVPPPGSPFGGFAVIGGRWGIGKLTEGTFAHELGHNFGLRHAPCGGPSRPDPNYPYVSGYIGKWGFDARTAELRAPDAVYDIMSYCGPKWISDYHYEKALSFRAANDWPEAAIEGTRSEEVLVLWGSVSNGSLFLEPAIRLNASVMLPDESGPYRLEGRDTAGGVVFSLSFSTTDTDHDGGGHFLFSLPAELAAADRLDAIILSGPEGQVEIASDPDVEALTVVTDRGSGRIRSILRGSTPEIPIPSDVNVRISDGVRTRSVGEVR